MNVNDKKSFYLYTLIVFSIILLVNVISYNRPVRIDLTDNQIFTLSNSTESVLSKINDNLIISIYFSDDLPSVLSNNSRFIQDILEEYQAHSNGNIRFEFKNPVKSIRKPIIRNKRNRRLTDTECQQIVGGNYSHQLLRSIIELALETGMRRGELLRIQRDHIKDQTLLIPYAKNGESRIIPLTKRARQILDHASLPFPVSANGLRLAWQRLRMRFNIKDLHFHDLRHEAISRFFEKGLSVAEVALISGHKDVRMLFRYTHLKAEDIVGKIN